MQAATAVAAARFFGAPLGQRVIKWITFFALNCRTDVRTYRQADRLHVLLH